MLLLCVVSGKIIAPIDFKRYAHRFVPSDTTFMPLPVVPSPSQVRIDIFGQEVPRLKNNPHYWKMTYKLNHPQYAHVREEMIKHRQRPVENASFVRITSQRDS